MFHLSRSLALAVLLSVAACAPRVAPSGPGLGGAPPSDYVQSGLHEEQAENSTDGVVFSRGILVTADGIGLPWRCWAPEDDPKRLILALHGFNDYSNAFDAPGRYLAGHSIKTCAYDQRGFGESPNTGLWAGADAMIADLKTASVALQGRYPGLPLFVLGDSMGGAVVLSAAARGDLPQVQGVILAAPAVWARATMPWYQTTALWVSVHTFPWAQFSGSGLKVQPSDNIEMLRDLGRDPLVIKETRVDAVYGLVDLMDQALAAAPQLDLPALILYGENDEILPADPTFEMWRSLSPETLPQQRRALYQDGWHMLLRDLQAETVLDDIVHWTANPTAPLPSGADLYAQEVLNGHDVLAEEETAEGD